MITPKQPTHDVKYDGVHIQVFHVNKGEGIPKHSHEYSHLTVCHAGSITVRKGGIEHVMNKNSTPVNLLAPDEHEIEATEDGTVFVNVFAEGKY